MRPFAGFLFPLRPRASSPAQSSWQSGANSKNRACRRHTVCYIANDLRYRKRQFNRRTRERIFFAAGVLSLALWLFMATAEICTPLHAWLHGGTIPDHDDCTVVVIAHGPFDSSTCDLPVVAPTTWIEVTPAPFEFPVFSPAIENLPLGCAPPALCIAS